ncbi:MAG: Fur family transcriptional regulator [Patescibacteria group bacterium]|nr:Fur family transcriptional regulator [Patescibacteria group bacterium]
MNSRELKQLFSLLSKQGIRLSLSRRAVLTVLAKARRPLSAADILKAKIIIQENVNRATVYRALSFLETTGIVELLYLAGDERLYHLNLNHHHHLICTSCQKIEAVHICNQLSVQENEIQASTGFKVQRHILEFYGLCRDCLEKNKI